MMLQPHLPESTVNGIADLLSDCLFAYLFGSAASGRLTPSSDIDIAVRYPEPLDQASLLDLKSRLEALLDRPVDLLDLATADPIICMQVLATGRRLVNRDSTARARFEMYVPIAYSDLKIKRRPVEVRIAAPIAPTDNA